MNEKQEKIGNKNKITFRLDDEVSRFLKDYAEKEKLSESLAAKQIVSAYFYDEKEILIVQEQVSKLDEKIKTVGLDFAFSMKKILELFGIKRGESDTWIRKNVKALKWNKEE